jgi:hypothetical protein
VVCRRPVTSDDRGIAATQMIKGCHARKDVEMKQRKPSRSSLEPGAAMLDGSWDPTRRGPATDGTARPVMIVIV